MKEILIWFYTLRSLKSQDLVAEHYEWYFDMIFHFKADQNISAEYYERDFRIIFHFKMVQIWLQGTMKEILTWSSTLRQLKTWFQSTTK